MQDQRRGKQRQGRFPGCELGEKQVFTLVEPGQIDEMRRHPRMVGNEMPRRPITGDDDREIRMIERRKHRLSRCQRIIDGADGEDRDDGQGGSRTHFLAHRAIARDVFGMGRSNESIRAGPALPTDPATGRRCCFQASRLPGEQAGGMADGDVKPRASRLTVLKQTAGGQALSSLPMMNRRNLPRPRRPLERHDETQLRRQAFLRAKGI